MFIQRKRESCARRRSSRGEKERCVTWTQLLLQQIIESATEAAEKERKRMDEMSSMRWERRWTEAGEDERQTRLKWQLTPKNDRKEWREKREKRKHSVAIHFWTNWVCQPVSHQKQHNKKDHGEEGYHLKKIVMLIMMETHTQRVIINFYASIRSHTQLTHMKRSQKEEVGDFVSCSRDFLLFPWLLTSSSSLVSTSFNLFSCETWKR